MADLRSKLSISETLLIQRFLGWGISTEIEHGITTPVFMDFSRNIANTFVYVMPLNSRKLLVEIVSYLPRKMLNLELQMKKYISGILQNDNYEIWHREAGSIPLTNSNFTRRNGKVIQIGTAGGQIKPTSGYGFSRMVSDSKMIASSLLDGHGKVSFRESNRFYRFCDSIFLVHMNLFPQLTAAVYTNLLRKCNVGQLFKFLDENANPNSILAVCRTIPLLPLRVILHLALESFHLRKFYSH